MINGSGAFKSGFAAIVGRPNVGKSTLLNTMVGRKVAITSAKPQTTRNRVLGVLHLPGAQVVLIDTPGIVRDPRHRLGEHMIRAAEGALREVEAVLFVVDAAHDPGPGDEVIAQRLSRVETPVILVLNKSDAVKRAELARRREAYGALGTFYDQIAVSALHGHNVDRLIAVLAGLMPEGPRYFPEDMVTDQPEPVLIAEFVREQLLLQTREEVPHAVAVVVEEFRERENGTLYARAVIYVERESQKGIVIGAGGRRLKAIGQAARAELERLLGAPLYLDLWVKVKKDWRNIPGALQEFGYTGD